MSIENGKYTHRWADQIRRMEKRPDRGSSPSAPKVEVKNPETLKAVQQELEYIHNLTPVKKSAEFANEVIVRLEKGEETKRDLLSTTPRIKIKYERNEDGSIRSKALEFRRAEKHCTFVYSNNSDGESMDIGENNLDRGYNNAIEGWVASGIKLIRTSIEEDGYAPKTTIDLVYSDNPSTITEQIENIDVKGPMEI